MYVSEDGICTINPDGTDRKVIVTSDKGAPFSNPKWSPEKKWIAFTGHVGRHRKIMLARSDGSKLDTLGLIKTSKSKKSKKEFPGVQVARVEQKDYDIGFESWSPDGKYLLTCPFVGFDISAFGLMGKKGKVKAQIGGSSPDFLGNEKIVYIVSYGGVTTVGMDIYTIPLNGEEKQNLTNDGKAIYYRPVSSAAGDRIVYGFGKASVDNELWIMNCDGSDRRMIASQVKDFVGGPLNVIKFSPQGSKILFLPYHGDRSKIYVINEDGTGLHTVVNDIVNAEGGADWSPNGEQIIFTSMKDGNAELYIVNVEGAGLKRLTNNNIKDCCPDW